jgi:hypothetical protein
MTHLVHANKKTRDKNEVKTDFWSKIRKKYLEPNQSKLRKIVISKNDWFVNCAPKCCTVGRAKVQ